VDGFAGVSINTAMFDARYDLKSIGDACGRFGVRALSLSRRDIDGLGLVSTGRYLRDAQLQVSTLSKIGPLTHDSREGRRAAVADAKVAIDQSAALQADCLVIIVGGIHSSKQASLEGVADVLNEIVPLARQANVMLSLEPLHPIFASTRGCVNSINEALDLMLAFPEGLGVTLDTFHLWWSREALRDIAAVPDGKIAAFQVADWLEFTGDPFTDRGMPGEGVAEIGEFASAVLQQGYCGFVDIEVLSARWAAKDLDVVMHAALASVEPYLAPFSSRSRRESHASG